VARKVGETFVDQVYLKLRGVNPFEVGPVQVTPGAERVFRFSVHNAYDNEDFNPFELSFAEALDRKKVLWCRNPSRSGYGVPLPNPGKSLTFFPDFLVWRESDVFAIDTKGAFLHADAARKLVSIKPAARSSTRVFVRFVSDGVVDAAGPQPDSSGYTVWTFKPSGEPEFLRCETLSEAADACLIPDV
jgi:type III restriction enzyme